MKKDTILKILSSVVLSLILLTCFAWFVPAQVTQIGGLAVAQSGTQWNRLKDASQGDGLTNGIAVVNPYYFNGSSFDRARGDTNGQRVQGASADNSANTTNKIPVLPCLATDQVAGLPTYTAGNLVPCRIATTGQTLVQYSGINFSSLGQVAVNLAQDNSLFNSQTTGAANTAVVVTIAALANARAHVFSIEAQCSAGTSTITIADAATIFTSMGANVPAAPATYRRDWNTPLTGPTNQAMTITLAACGVGNTGTLMVQGGRV